MAVGRRAECRGRALEGVEHHQAALAREFLGARDDRLDMRRMQDHRERLGRRLGELRDAIEHRGQFVLMRRPSRGAKSGADFQHDRIDDRIAIEDAQNLVEVALVNAAANGAARVERIAIAAADDVEERSSARRTRNPTASELRAARSRTCR